MRFEHPVLLILSLLVLAIVLFAARSRAPQGRFQNVAATCLAGLALLLVVGALAGPLWQRPVPTTRIAIAAGATDAEQQIRSWREATPHGDPFHVVAAGATPRFGARGEVVIPAHEGAVDLTAALQVAAALIPEEGSGEILLLDQGVSVGTDPRLLIRQLEHRGIVVHRSARSQQPPSPRLLSATVAAHAHEHAPIRIEARLDSPGTLEATLLVRNGDRLLARQPITLRAGEQSIPIDVEPDRRGAVVLTVALETNGSVDQSTGVESVALWIEGVPRLLHLSQDDGTALAQTLAPAVQVITRDPQAGLSESDLAACDAVLLDDLPAGSWPEASQQRLRDAVLEQGLGLWVVGAYRSLGPGGYGSSPLADVLPVDLPQREEHRDPSVSLVVILDTSGSMGGTRIELAKEVARLAMRRLQPHDKVGLVEFYGSKRWAAPLQPASNLIEVQRAVNRLQAGGGTIIYSAIEEAYYALLNVRTRFKHVLVLTDGGVENAPFEALARKMAEAGINLNTVLVGPQSSSQFLMDLAQWGRGRFYAAPSRFQLPDLRFKEPQSSPLPAVQEQSMQLSRAGVAEATLALEGPALPSTLGFVDARQKPGAETWIAGDAERPFLVSWDQGQGRVVVMAGEMLGPFAERLRAEPRWRSMLIDTTRALARSREAMRPTLEHRISETGVQVFVHGVPGATWPVPTLQVETGATADTLPTTGAPAGAPVVLPLTPLARGSFTTFVPFDSADRPLVLTVRHQTLPMDLKTAVVRPESRTARAPQVGPALDTLVRATGGTTDTDPSTLATARAATGKTAWTSLSAPFALAAALLFLLALLVRRLPLPMPAAAMMLLPIWVPAENFPLLLPQQVPAATTSEDPAHVVQRELRDKGHLEDLKVAWKDRDAAHKLAIARAEGDLDAVLALLPGEGTPEEAQYRIERALLLEATGRVTDAIRLLDRHLGDDGAPLGAVERAGVLLRRGELKRARGDHQGADQDLRAAAETAGIPEFTRRIGLLAGSLGLPKTAIALAGTGATYTDWLRIARWHQVGNDVDAAARALKNAYQAARLQRDRRFVLAHTITLMREHGRLAEFADQLVTGEEDAVERAALLWMYRDLERPDAALALLSKASDDPRVAEQALAVAVESGDSKRAIQVATDHLAEQPSDLRVRTVLALLLTDQRRGREAAEVLTGGLAFARRTGDLRFLLETATELALDEVATKVLDQMGAAVEGDPEGTAEAVVDAAIAKADWLRRRRRAPEAPAVLKAAQDSVITSQQMVRLGEAFESHADPTSAVELYHKAFEQSRTEDIGLRLAWLLSTSSRREDQQRAFELFRHVWLNAGSHARRVQVEERVLDLAAREGTLADLALELEADLKNPEEPARAQKRAALVKIYTRAKDTVAAAQILREYSREPGKEVDALIDLARMHMESEEFRPHDRVLRQLIEIDPKHKLDYLQQLAVSALERGRPAEARTVIREMLENDDANEVAFEFAAGIYQLAARFDEAVRVYRRSLARNPDRIETWLLLANALRAANKREQAIGSFVLLLVEDVKDDLFLVAADGLLNMDAPAATLRFAERAVRRRIAETPDRVYLHRLLQDLLEALRDNKARREAMLDTVLVAGEQRAIFVRELMDEARDAKDFNAYVAYGEELLFLGDELPPSVFVELGEALLKTDQLRAAERAFQRARLSSDFAAVERRVADAFEQAGHLEDAERVQRRILRRDPENTSVVLRITRLCELRGALAEARGLYLELVGQALQKEPPPARSGTGSDRTRATGVAASARAGTVIQSIRPNTRNRTITETGPALATVVEGYLRCSHTAEDLQPLWQLLEEKAVAKDTSPEQQADLAPWLRRIAAVAGDHGSRQQLVAVETQLLASGQTPVVRAIVAGRLADGDFEGASDALEAHAGDGLHAERMDLMLATRQFEQVKDAALAGTATAQAEAIRRLWTLGAREQAREIFSALTAAKESGSDVQTSWVAAARVLGEPVPEPPLSDARLVQAQAQTDPARRLSAVLTALRATPALPDARKQEALRLVLPAAENDQSGNLAVQFLALAEPLLSRTELGPVVERALANFDNPYLVSSRLPWLRLLPEDRQKPILDKAMRTMEGGERNSQVIRMLANSRDLPELVLTHLVELLKLDGLSPTERFAFTQLAIASQLPPEIGRRIFERTTAIRDDARSWLLGARYAKDDEERRGFLIRAVAVLSERKTIEPADLAVVTAVAQAVRAMPGLDGPSLFTGDGDGAALLQVEWSLASGDAETAAARVLPIAMARPEDTSMLNKALSVLAQANDSQNAYLLMKEHVRRAAQVYPYQKTRLAQLCIDVGKPEEAVALLSDEDTQNFGGPMLLEAATLLTDPEQRSAALRRWQARQAQTSGRTNIFRAFSGASERESRRTLEEVVQPLAIPRPAARSRAEWQRSMDERDLLAFAPEGASVAQAILRPMAAEDRDAAGPLYRAVAGSLRLRGEDQALVAANLAVLEQRPFDAEALRQLFAAAQVGIQVPPEVVTRETQRRLAQRRADLGFLVDALLVAHSEGDRETTRRLLVPLLDRSIYGQQAVQTRLPVIFAIAARVAPELLLATAPGGNAPSAAFDGELLAALLDHVPDEELHHAFRATGETVRQVERTAWRERLALPWCGLQLRRGDLEAAVEALSANWTIGAGDQFSSPVLAATIPELARFAKPDQWQALRDTLLAETEVQTTRGQLFFRLAVLLAVRLKNAALDEHGDKLLAELDRRGGALPMARAWLQAARSP